ncbi:MAG: PilZ domain-containing protein [Nitrospiraceae bacterium]|nr:MAG: PilZ domain-containing protein [Nitrospiraceae bacterium]
MERRYSERIKAGYKTEILYGNKTYTGVVENISASGVNVLTDELDPGIDFLPDENIELKFESREGVPVVLKCSIMWTSKIPPHNIRHRIGMEIDETFRDRVDVL